MLTKVKDYLVQFYADHKHSVLLAALAVGCYVAGSKHLLSVGLKALLKLNK